MRFPGAAQLGIGTRHFTNDPAPCEEALDVFSFTANSSLEPPILDGPGPVHHLSERLVDPNGPHGT
jgi:hypothetical protein